MTPANPNPDPTPQPRTVRVTLPVDGIPPAAPAAASPGSSPASPGGNGAKPSALGEGSIRIPATPPLEPTPVPNLHRSAAARTATRPPEAETAEEVGSPQLRVSSALKIDMPAAPPASRTPPPLRAPRSSRSVWGVRFALLFAIGVALGLLYWSVFMRLLPVTAEHRDKAQQMTRLADELERLRNRWNPQQIEEIKARHERAQAALFDTSRDLGPWQSEVGEQARMQVLDAKVALGPLNPLPAAGEAIGAMTAQVNVSPNQVLGATTSPYARVLKFTEALAASPKRLDFLELSVTGDSNSVSQVQAVVQLLTVEKEAL